MGRSRYRVCLQDGLKLDFNQLVRDKFVLPGAKTGPVGIAWSSSYWGEIASGEIAANLDDDIGDLRIRIGDVQQRIIMVARARHFGGRQWYFICPVMHRRASVLWWPPGANRFASRQAWGRHVAYRTQFMAPSDRAHAGQARIEAKLIGAPGEWDLPPKPKWMRWRTYNRQLERFDAYEEILDRRTVALVSKLMR